MKKIIFSLVLIPLLTNCTPQGSGELHFDDSAARSIATAYLDYDVSPYSVDRSYVESVFDQVFGTSGNTDGVENSIYQNTVFGGACDRYAASDNGGASYEFPRQQCYTGIDAVLPANSNPMRYSFTTRICENLVNGTNTFNSAMKKVLNVSSLPGTLPAPTDATIARAYQLFFQAEVPPADVISALSALTQNSSSTKESWQRILTTVCVSPEWQVF